MVNSQNAAATTFIEPLAGQLDALALLDTARVIFGSDLHNYAREPVAERALAELEAEAGFALPADYRQWMLRIGAGAGPDYGLWTPTHAIAQMRDTPDGSGGLVREAAAVDESHLAIRAQLLRGGSEPGDTSISTDSIRGAVPIGRQGCSGFWYLLLTGAFAGCVLGESCDCIGEPWTAAAAFWPAGRLGTLAPLTFLGWLEDWLDDAFRSLADGETRR